MSSRLVKSTSNNHTMNSNNSGAGGTNIWQLMNYPVPRGKCVHKASVLSSACPCLRFMLNPLQAASSFACDGCGHHASFHTLKNAEEEGENFAVEQMNAVHARGATIGAARKRTATVQGSHTRAITNGSAKRGVALLSSDDDGDLQLLDGDVMPVVKRTRGGA